jgi:hypothetical protein
MISVLQWLSQGYKDKKIPDSILILSGTNNHLTRGATLLHGMTHALAGYLHIPGN